MAKVVRIALTGGGTAGHVMPHIALLSSYEQKGWQVFYIGSSGVEKQLISAHGIPFSEIAAGKLRRYLSFRNVIDVFKVGFGFLQSLIVLLRKKPDLIFSKGGFVSVPVAVAGWVLRIPVVSHESDITPGLATKIISKFAHTILYSFPETKGYLSSKSEWVGLPVRRELFSGSREKGLHLSGITPGDSKVILVMGGSLGALKINQAFEEALPSLVDRYSVIHLTGKGKAIDFQHERYCQFEFVSEGIEHLFALADLVVCRAGANSIFELLALEKPMLLIPLSGGSRGDQIHNAKCFKDRNWAHVLVEDELSKDSLIVGIDSLAQGSEEIKASVRNGTPEGGAEEKILKLLSELIQNKNESLP